jgi:excinuclease UvrABC nuclease subunit
MCKWQDIGLLNESTTDFSIYNRDIGIYKAELNGELVYIGKATELSNGGFRKRLRDYTRESDSARNYPSGRLMHENKDEIIISIHICERSQQGIIEAEILEKEQIKRHDPVWNKLDYPERQF